MIPLPPSYALRLYSTHRNPRLGKHKVRFAWQICSCFECAGFERGKNPHMLWRILRLIFSDLRAA